MSDLSFFENLEDLPSMDDFLELEPLEGLEDLDNLDFEEISDPDVVEVLPEISPPLVLENLDLLVLDDLPESSLVTRRVIDSLAKLPSAVSFDQTLEIIKTQRKDLENTLKQLKTADKEHAESVVNKLFEYYEKNNINTIPFVEVSRDGYSRSLEHYVLNGIRNHKSVSDILLELKLLLQDQTIMVDAHTQYKLVGDKEREVLEFLENLQRYYESELSAHDRQPVTGLSLLSEVGFDNAELSTVIVQNMICPDEIKLLERLFVCGSCKETSEFRHPFISAAIINIDSDEKFLSLQQTFERCTVCGALNVLPSNYFERISRGLRNLIVKEEVRELIVRLNQLCRMNSYMPYELAPSDIMEAVPPEFLGLFSMDVIDYDGGIEENLQEDFDYKKASEDYLSRINALSTGLGGRPVDNVFTESSGLSDTVIISFNKDLAKVLCGVLGHDYNSLKLRAVNSLIHFMEDSFPFGINPHGFNLFSCACLLGDLPMEDLDKGRERFEKIIDYCIEYREVFSFIPLLRIGEAEETIFSYSTNPKLREFLDYCSENIILFSLRDDILRLGSVQKHSSALWKDTSKLSAGLDKLQDVICGGDSNRYIQRMGLSVKSSLYNKYQYFVGIDYTDLFRLFSKRDLYGLASALLNPTDRTYQGIDVLIEAVKPFELDIETMSRELFNYNKVFTPLELEGVDLSWLETPICPPRNEASVEEYFDRIKFGTSVRYGDHLIAHSEWFNQNIDSYFDVLVKYLIGGQDREAILFVDLLKALACNDLEQVLGFLGISKEIAKGLLSRVKSFEFPQVDNKNDLARLVLCEYPYTNLDLQEIITKDTGRGVKEVRYLSELLVAEFSDQIAEELQYAPESVQSLLTECFGLELENVS